MCAMPKPVSSGYSCGPTARSVPAVDERLELPREPRLSGDPPERLRGHSRRPGAGREEHRRRGVPVHEPLAWSTTCVGMSTGPLPCTRTSKYHHGRLSVTPSTSFSRWCTLSCSMAGSSSRNAPKSAAPRPAASPRSSPAGARGRPAPRATACRRAHGSLIHAAVVWCALCPRSARTTTSPRRSSTSRPSGSSAVVTTGTPVRRVRGTAVEALDEGEEVTQLGALVRVDEDLVGRTRLWHAQGQGGVEVARVQEEQRVRGCVPRRRRAPASFSRSRRCGRME